jgi:hypothetical protein
MNECEWTCKEAQSKIIIVDNKQTEITIINNERKVKGARECYRGT